MIKAFDKFFCWFYSRVVKPSKLPKPSSQSDELKKLALARIATGVVMLVRCGLSTFAAYYYFQPEALWGMTLNFHFVASLLILVLVTLFTLGVLTPISTLLILIFYSEWDIYMDSATLGTMILIQLLLLLFVTSSGLEYSVDNAIINGKPSWLRNTVLAQYAIFGKPGRKLISSYYFLTFLAYAVTSIGALTYHITDEYWCSGETIARLMTSSFLCPEYSLTRKLQEWQPALFIGCSKLAVLFQSAYQLFMPFLVYNRLGYLFVLVWGGMFFLISWSCLQLSYLAPLELIMWLVVMIPTPKSLPTMQTKNSPINIAPQKKAIAGFIAPSFLILCIPFAFQSSLVVHRFPQLALSPPIAKALYRVGLWCPDVFNRVDLGMSDNWCVIYRCFEDGTKEIVPLNNLDGSRNFYYLMDPLYFGNGLPYRRRFGYPDFNTKEVIDPQSGSYALVKKVISFDRKLYTKIGKHPAPDFYRVEVLSTDRKYKKGSNQDPDSQDVSQRIFEYDYRL